MKSKIYEEIKDLFSQTTTWAKLEIEYVKLTAAEKLILLNEIETLCTRNLAWLLAYLSFFCYE